MPQKFQIWRGRPFARPRPPGYDLSMNKRLRAFLPIAVVAVLLYVTWEIKYVRDAALWVFLMYMVLGSVTGGVRVVVAQFTRRPTFQMRSRLGLSWVMLTLWLLKVVFGLSPPEPSEPPEPAD